MLTNNFYQQRACLLLLLLTLSSITSCSKGESDKKAKNRPQSVAVIEVKRGPLTIARQMTGSLEPISLVRIISEAQGRITQLPFYPGDRVEKGQLLIQLDDAEARAELDKATATYSQARLNLKRIQSLKPRKLASEDEIARAQTAVDLAKAEVSLRQTHLARTHIMAPFAGIISERFKEAGDVVSLHDHVLTLIDDTSLKVRIRVSEYLLSELHKDTLVQVTIDALGEQDFAGKILRVYPAVDPATRLGTAEVLLSPVPANARAGQLGRVKLNISTTPLLSLPFAAIKHDSRGDYVFTVDEQNKAHYTPISTGLQAGDHIQIIDGLSEGMKVITKGHIGLRDGKAVKISTPSKNTKAIKEAQPGDKPSSGKD